MTWVSFYSSTTKQPQYRSIQIKEKLYRIAPCKIDQTPSQKCITTFINMDSTVTGSVNAGS